MLGGGLEPPCLSVYAPQTYVSAISPPERSRRECAAPNLIRNAGKQEAREVPGDSRNSRVGTGLFSLFTRHLSLVTLFLPPPYQVVCNRMKVSISGSLPVTTKNKSLRCLFTQQQTMPCGNSITA